MIHLRKVSYLSYLGKKCTVSFHLSAGETALIFGQKKSGKTEFLNLCLGAVPILEGGIAYSGKSIADIPNFFKTKTEYVGYASQHRTLIDNLNIENNIGLPLSYHLDLSRKEVKSIVMPLMKKFGIEKLANKFSHELSLIEAKLAQIARAVILKPKILLLDEPTGADLDLYDFNLIIDIIRKCQNDGLSILITTTSPSLASIKGAKCYYLIDGNLFANGDIKEMSKKRNLDFFKQIQLYVERHNTEITDFFQNINKNILIKNNGKNAL